MPETATKTGGAVLHRTTPETTDEPESAAYTDDGGSLDLDLDTDAVDKACEKMEAALENADDPADRLDGAYAGAEEDKSLTGRVHRMGQMGARRIGQLAIGIGVVGIVLNEMSNLAVVNQSTGVVDVSTIFQTAGQGLNLLVIGVIIAAAAVLLQLWSGF